MEFGYKTMLTEIEERIITHFEVHTGKPTDSILLIPAFKEHVRVIGKVLWAVATDRGFSGKTNETYLEERGVQRVNLPYRGHRSPPRGEYEHRWQHSRMRGQEGARIHCGWGILAYNLSRPATLSRAAARERLIGRFVGHHAP